MEQLTVNVKKEITEEVKVSLPAYVKGSRIFNKSEAVAILSDKAVFRVFLLDSYVSFTKDENHSNINQFFNQEEYERISETEFKEALEEALTKI